MWWSKLKCEKCCKYFDNSSLNCCRSIGVDLSSSSLGVNKFSSVGLVDDTIISHSICHLPVCVSQPCLYYSSDINICGTNNLLLSSVKKKSKSLLCDHCGKFFSSLPNFQQHIKSVHEGLKPEICTTCNKTFRSKYHLFCHVEGVHEGRKPYVCNVCTKRFLLKCFLKIHIESVHEGKRSFGCNVCGKSFSSKRLTKFHIDSKHFNHSYDKHIVISYTLTLPWSINTVHKGKRSFVCNICSKRFSRIPSIKLHIDTNHFN